jgi:hypothetical protein
MLRNQIIQRSDDVTNLIYEEVKHMVLMELRPLADMGLGGTNMETGLPAGDYGEAGGNPQFAALAGMRSGDSCTNVVKRGTNDPKANPGGLPPPPAEVAA